MKLSHLMTKHCTLINNNNNDDKLDTFVVDIEVIIIDLNQHFFDLN